MANIKNKVRDFVSKQNFAPSAIGVLINPAYFERRGLLRGILKFTSKLQGGTLLDFGCGNKPYQKYFKVDKYIGLDVKDSNHEHLNEAVDVFYDGKTIPFENETFDHIFSSEVFEHIFNLDEVLSEINRVLKINGNLFITLPFVWEEHLIPYDFARYTSYGINFLLKKHGFEIVNIDKDINYIEVVFQMWNIYLGKIIPSFPRIIPLRSVWANILFIAPFTILGLILSKILPKKYNLYCNNIIHAKKIK